MRDRPLFEEDREVLAKLLPLLGEAKPLAGEAKEAFAKLLPKLGTKTLEEIYTSLEEKSLEAQSKGQKDLSHQQFARKVYQEKQSARKEQVAWALKKAGREDVITLKLFSLLVGIFSKQKQGAPASPGYEIYEQLKGQYKELATLADAFSTHEDQEFVIQQKAFIKDLSLQRKVFIESLLPEVTVAKLKSIYNGLDETAMEEGDLTQREFMGKVFSHGNADQKEAFKQLLAGEEPKMEVTGSKSLTIDTEHREADSPDFNTPSPKSGPGSTSP